MLASALASYSMVAAFAGCTADDNDNVPITSVDAGGSLDAVGSPLDSGVTTDGASSPEAATNNTPSEMIVFPIDVIPVTFAKPRNIDTEMDVSIHSTSLGLFAAYLPDGGFVPDRVFRFEQRTYTHPDELPPAAGVRVWWRKIDSDTNASSNYVCSQSYDNGFYIKVISNAGSEAEPDTLYRDQCSFTLWRAPDGSYAIRRPAIDSDETGGLFLSSLHASANEAYHLQIKGMTVDTAPRFTFYSPLTFTKL